MPRQRGLGRDQARLELLALLLGAVVDARRAQRISGGSVSPCSTSVTKITANVRKIEQVALREVQRERERGRQRDRAAHPGPAADDPQLPASSAARAADSRRSSARIEEHDRAAARPAASSTTAALTAAA